MVQQKNLLISHYIIGLEMESLNIIIREVQLIVYLRFHVVPHYILVNRMKYFIKNYII